MKPAKVFFPGKFSGNLWLRQQQLNSEKPIIPTPPLSKRHRNRLCSVQPGGMGALLYGSNFHGKTSLCVDNVPNSLPVYIIGSSGRIRPTTGTWAEPLFSVPNLIHDVPLNGSGDCIERGEHKVGQEEGCAASLSETYIAHVITSADDICQQSTSKNAYFAGP